VRRIQARRGNGRFTRNTLGNTFGLRAWVCASCRRFNTTGVGAGPPTVCHACGEPFVDIADAEDGGD
jgi:rubrerythrin